MKLQIIETPEYYLAVSDDDVGVNIPFWGYCWNWYKKVNFFKNGLNENARGRGGIQKIIAYQPKGNAPELPHIVKLPSDENVNIQKISRLPLLPEIIVEDDVEKLAELKYPINSTKGKMEMLSRHQLNNSLKQEGFIEGYESATKVYSEEDLRKYHNIMCLYGNVKGEEFIQSLKQPKTPKWFVAEMQTTKSEVYREHDNAPYAVFKTTTINGKTYLVGTYKFE